ncbi:MAG: DNA primase, partial [Gammaproteobacteria bacterium]
LNRNDIVEVVDTRVPLKKKGKEFWACCPFHNEKTASFSVSQNKQFYHCFGCQQSGNAIGFLMDYEHMEFVEAIESLAHMAGLEVPYERGQAPLQSDHGFDPIYSVLQQSSEFYLAQLKQNQDAIDYLRQRGIGSETARDYSIGFAPPGWSNLPGERKALSEAGMIVEKDDGQHYDRFRKRLMFPIRDRRGRTIAFGGRVIDPEDNPKYLNSPETPVFHKGGEIYGLFELKKAVQQIDQILITEGYMDVIALAQHGVKTAVATLGTAINNAQIEKLFRVSKTLVFCFDGDSAGQKAAWRSLEQSLASLSEGRLAKFLFLPEGHDPDTYIREHGKAHFQQAVDNSSTLTEFLFETLLSQCNVRTLEGKSQFLDRLRPYFSQIPLQSLKDQILGEVELQLSVKLDNRLLKILGEEKRSSGANPRLPEQHWSPTRLAINLLLQKPSLAANTGTHHELAEADIAGVDLLLQLLDHIQEVPGITPQNLLDRFRGNEHEAHLYRLAAMRPAMDDEQSMELMFEDCLQRLQEKYIDDRKLRLIKKLQSGEPLSDAEKQEHKQLFTKR